MIRVEYSSLGSILKFNLSLILSALLLVGCGGTLAPNKIHDGPTSKTEILIETSAAGAADSAIITEIKSLRAETNDQAVLEKADQIFFTLSHWQNKRMTTSTDFQAFIDQVSAAALRAQKTTPDLAMVKSFWVKLSGLVDGLCSDNLKSCTTVNTFRTTPQGAELLRQLGESQSSIDKKYKYFFIGLDLQNQNFPEAAVDSFLKDAKQFRSQVEKDLALAQKNGQSQIIDEKQSMLTKVNSTLNMLLSLVKEGKVRTSNTDWIRDLNLTQSIKETDTELAARYVLYEKGSKNLSAEMKSEIARLQKMAGSFDSKMSQISAKMIATFDLTRIERDEYFYVIDQVYSSRWSTKQGETFITAAGLDSEKVISVGRQYIRAEVAYLVTLAQIDLKSLLNDYTKIEAKSLFVQAQQSFSRSSIEAISLPEKAQKIAQLVRVSSVDSKRADEFSSQVTDLHKTIKKTIVYPTTMIIFTLLNRLGVAPTDELQSINCDRDPSPKFSSCVQTLFLGTLKSPLAFTEDTTALNAIELLESVELTAKSGYFDVTGLTTDDIITTLFDLLTIDKVAKLNEEIEHLSIKYSASEWADLQVLAKSTNSANPPARNISLTEMIYSPTLGSAMPTLNEEFNGQTNTSSGVITLLTPGYFFSSNRISEQLERIRSDLFNLFQYFDTMQIVLKKSSSTEMPKLQKRIQTIKLSARQFVATALKRMQEFNQTYFPLVAQEINNTNLIIKYEAAYWKFVHETMKTLRANRSQEKISHSQFALQLPNDAQYRTVITGDSVSAYEFDFMLRAGHYLKQGLKPASLAAIRPNLNILIADGVDNTELYRNSKVNLIKFVENESEFVQNAINATGVSAATSEIRWFYRSYLQVYAFRNYYDINATLYRMGPLAKRILNLDTVSKDQLLQVPLRVLKHFNQTTEEKQAVALLGMTTRYNLEQLEGYGIFFNAIDSDAAPVYDYILTELIKRGMSTFGHSDIDDARGSAISFPLGIVPVSVIAEQIAQFHLNKSQNLLEMRSVAADVYTSGYKLTVSDDLRLVTEAKQAIQEAGPLLVGFNQINYQTNKTLRLNIVSAYVLKNVEASRIHFHNRTSGFYK